MTGHPGTPGIRCRADLLVRRLSCPDYVCRPADRHRYAGERATSRSGGVASGTARAGRYCLCMPFLNADGDIYELYLGTEGSNSTRTTREPVRPRWIETVTGLLDEAAANAKAW